MELGLLFILFMLMWSYIALEFTDHSALQQMMWQFAQFAQVVIQSTRKARVGAEMQRLFRYHPVHGFVIARRRADRTRPSNIIIINTRYHAMKRYAIRRWQNQQGKINGAAI